MCFSYLPELVSVNVSVCLLLKFMHLCVFLSLYRLWKQSASAPRGRGRGRIQPSAWQRSVLVFVCVRVSVCVSHTYLSFFPTVQTSGQEGPGGGVDSDTECDDPTYQPPQAESDSDGEPGQFSPGPFDIGETWQCL